MINGIGANECVRPQNIPEKRLATDRGIVPSGKDQNSYRRAASCFKGSQAASCALLLTHCWIKYIPSTPS
jgi:hypothetical protein